MKIFIALMFVFVGFGAATTALTPSKVCFTSYSDSNVKQRYASAFKHSFNQCDISTRR
ncbi:hypothetical protein [Helicobacter mastomyrinus]|uniref:Uncharacterized protein n=1 Tax=Helicobacter mastomyrinus TaxID=287948 RepID=A0ABZ3F2F9_9HELI|nr:hypothetical protein [uncultured Helicobacter sp.]